MRFPKSLAIRRLLFLVAARYSSTSSAWFDETHLTIAKTAGYTKWFNAAGPDVAKLKNGDKEGHNHFVNTPQGHRSHTGDDPGPKRNGTSRKIQ